MSHADNCMRFDNIIIEDEVKEKILSLHNVGADEIKGALSKNPLILKTKLNRYIAVSHYERYLTIIIEFKNKIANIITAYPSSDSQIKLYKKKKKL